MSDLDDIRARLAALEAQVAQEAQLRAAVDRDQGELVTNARATQHFVHGISIVQGQHTDRLERLESTQGTIIGLLQQILERLPPR